ncbi:TetR/AcrR family transcriptional regulator [Spongiibacter sp. KMU-166]|uniref:TetR/AcrR family transcriptional regulator n=1 Tax=Spongiibacter thalassae TaxID=2721624 RepID=A0ABX1GH61_9GAMM|nr:TetR/AcrR family transcriptional regulator [Spongiibacter thalassae]NKI18535.1 TetR/AcrR family transcriptional regulator [Spongiibacter thalassae]
MTTPAAKANNENYQRILSAGYTLISRKGFSAVGLAELLVHAGVPKGSFYYYFKSKEQFGEALVDHYFDDYQQRVKQLFSAPGLNAKDKLLRYWQEWLRRESAEGDCGKCLVVKLGAEVAELSEPIRLRLKAASEKTVQQLADLIERGNRDGSLTITDPTQCAAQLYQMWLGASLLTKLQQSAQPLQRAYHSTEIILNTP